MSDTEGWSNRRLNERIRDLESKLGAVRDLKEYLAERYDLERPLRPAWVISRLEQVLGSEG